MRSVETVVHARCQPQRDVETIAMALDEKRRAQKIGQAVGKAFDLNKLGPGNPPVGANDRVAWAHDDLRIAVDRSRPVLQLAREAVVDTLELFPACFAQVQIGEELPQRN